MTINKKSNSFGVAFFVIPLVQNSNSLLEDLRRLNQLKDVPLQNDVNVKTIEKQPKKISNLKSDI